MKNLLTFLESSCDCLKDKTLLTLLLKVKHGVNSKVHATGDILKLFLNRAKRTYILTYIRTYIFCSISHLKQDIINPEQLCSCRMK